MSRAHVRRRAERLLAEQGFDGLPTPVEKIAKRLGLGVVYAELGDGISGVLVRDGAETYICVHKGDAKARHRFTIAHEIGHFVLNHPMEPGRHVHVDRERQILQRGPKASTGLDRIEVEANQFAAEILMPSARVREHVAAMGVGPLTEGDVRELAKKFHVSEQAMLNRLDSLRIL